MEDSANPPEGRLLKVYPPEGAEDDTSVDIIAIHGLGTTTPRTWEYKTKAGTVINWLSDSNLLPDIVPSARIYTFSWNASYAADAPANDTHSRPLIFVGSCFGGLIVTKALDIANIHDSVYRKVLVATSGVLFLGSPLQGTRAGKAAQWHVMIAGILNRHPSQTLLQDLDGSTKALRETTHRFVNMITTSPMQMMTMCFWETQESQVLRAIFPERVSRIFKGRKMILVEEDSAVLLGRGNKPLDASHSMMNKFGDPSDANFVLVSDEIQEMVKYAKKIAVSQREGIYWPSLAHYSIVRRGKTYNHPAFHLHHEHFMVSRIPNPLFTGREKELEKLKEALCPSLSTKSHTAVPKIYVIHGMGGAGKSEVALRFAHDNRPEFWGIFWIDGRSEGSITNGFASIARTCGHHDESLEGAMSWLQNTSHSWLLVIDNADNNDLDLAQFLPAGENGNILITTRLTECATHQTVGKDSYERLNQGTAINLLLKACDIELSLGSPHEDHARTVAELLGCHALAIIQAGATVRHGICDLGEYKDIFQSQRQRLLHYFPAQRKSTYGGAYATFEVSAAYLEARNDQIAKDAIELLRLYAFMHFEDFPEAAFEEVWRNSRDEAVISSRLLSDGGEDITNLAPWHVSHLPEFMKRDLHDTGLSKSCFRQARSLLASLSLVAFDSARGTTRMHPVSHFWARDRQQNPEESMKARLNSLSVLSLSIKSPYANDLSPWARQLQSHVESTVHSLKEWDSHRHKIHFQQSVFRLSWVMNRLSSGSALFELLRMIPIQKDESWIRFENAQSIQNLHGVYMCKYGDASEAVALLEKVIEAQVHTSAAEDPKRLHPQHNLAIAYMKLEETTKAIELLERVVQKRNETLSPEHEDRLKSQHELARAYLKVDQTSKAIALLKSVVEIQEKTLRAEYPHSLISQHELARAYLQVDQTSKAIALLEPVVEIQEKTLRADHPDRVRSIYALAQCHYKAWNYDRALQLAKSIEHVAQNRPGGELADWNATLIGYILEDIEQEKTRPGST